LNDLDGRYVYTSGAEQRGADLAHSRPRCAARGPAPTPTKSLSLSTFHGVPTEGRVLSADRQRLLIVFAIIPSIERFETVPLLDGDALWQRSVKIWNTTDSAMEWMEEQILTAHGIAIEQKERPLELKDFPLFRELSEKDLSMIKERQSEVSIKRDQTLFLTGQTGDEMFLVRRGAIRIVQLLRRIGLHR
jgi:hypothetical protein